MPVVFPGDETPASPPGSRMVSCTLCGQQWDKWTQPVQPHTPAAGHTDADWDAWRKAQVPPYADGASYPRFNLLDTPPPNQPAPPSMSVRTAPPPPKPEES